MWPEFVFSERFFNRDAYGKREIEECIARCQLKAKEVVGRMLRLQQVCCRGDMAFD